MIRRTRKPKQIMIEIPPESQAMKRPQSVSEQAQLTYYELLLKWLDDEEKAIQVQRDGVEPTFVSPAAIG